MIRKLFIKYSLFLGLAIVPVGGVYFLFHSMNQLSTNLAVMNDDFISKQNNEKKQYLGQLVSLVELNQKELEQEIRAHILDGELGDLISNSEYGESYSLRLESWLKALTEKLDLDQIVIFSDRGIVLAGYSDKPFLGASGLVDGGGIAFSYRPLVESAFISRGTTFYDLLPDNGYNKRTLSLAVLLPLRDSNQSRVAGFGATKRINPDVLFANYRKTLGEYAPKPFFTTDLNSNKDDASSYPIVNHHREKIALLGIEKNIVIPGSVQATLILAEQINKFCYNSFIFIIIFAAIVLLLFMTDLILAFRKKTRSFPIYQDARQVLEKSRQQAFDDIFYFS